MRRTFLRHALPSALTGITLLTSCAAPQPAPKPSPPPSQTVSIYESKPFFVQEGIASWYGGRWIGRLTANGERYRAGDLTAAHRTLPFDSRVVVTDLKTGKQVVVRINNRGPYVRGRIIDLSVVAAKQLGMYARGLARVRIEAFKKIPLATKPNLKVPKASDAPSASRQKKEKPGPSAS
ncbi:MAG: septal ring lytic transglycosylase RlpA family protein [Terrimicrobiaceae bacterium]|nr:septal ring lytic transglycosylase RlpA family protein [Terrimicrobiaceae bacterium]